MPQPTFRGDPYQVLGVPADASDATIKRRWRSLAREHHPDRAADPREAAGLTRRMARINAAYDVLRDPDRRARHDEFAASGRPGSVWAAGVANARRGPGPVFEADEPIMPAGPPQPRPTRPVTARFDTTTVYHRRNATKSRVPPPLPGQRPVALRDRRGAKEPLRASDPCGPVLRRRGGRRVRIPTVEESRAVALLFGKFRGHTLGEVEAFEPTYIDWIAGTITRDRDLVMAARVIQADMDVRGVERRLRRAAPTAGEGTSAAG